MPEIQEQNVQNIQNNNQIKELSEIYLIQNASKKMLQNIGKKRVLVLVDKFFNGEGKITIRRQGWRLKVPGLQDGYIIDLTKYTAVVKNPETQDGRYEQDIGMGDDISLTMKIKFSVKESVRSFSRLIDQRGAYKDSIRSASETIMRLLIQKNYRENQQQRDELTNQRKIASKVFDLTEKLEAAKRRLPQDEIDREIVKELMNLYDTCGINITSIDFTDIDLSKRLKDELVKDISAAKQRTRDEEQSKLEVIMAQNRAKAIEIEQKMNLDRIVEKLKEAGFSTEQITAYLRDYVKMTNMPQNAVVFMGGEQQSQIPGFVAAGMIPSMMSNQNNTQQQGTHQETQDTNIIDAEYQLLEDSEYGEEHSHRK